MERRKREDTVQERRREEDRGQDLYRILLLLKAKSPGTNTPSKIKLTSASQRSSACGKANSLDSTIN